jgi:hypothetical protein
MHLPYLRSRKQKTEKQIVAFRGVNYGEAVRDGDLSESQNLTAERFPCLSPRGGRTAEGNYDSATAVYYFRGMRFVVDGNKLTADGAEIITVSPGKKQFAAVNNKLVVFPDKIQYDTETAEVRSLTAEYTSDAGMLEFVNGKEVAVHLGAYNAAVISSGNIGGADINKLTIDEDERPFSNKLSSVSVNKETGAITFGTKSMCPIAEELPVGMLFVSASLGANGVTTWGKVTKKYSEPIYPTPPGGTPSERTYHNGFDYDIYGVKGADFEQFDGFESLNFRKGDTVEISGATTFPDHNRSYTIRDFGTHKTSSGEELPTLIFDADVFPNNGVEAGAITIRRKVPNLTVVTESNNRLWGAEGNTIFASALGDPTNFYTYDGLDTDSYAVAVASEGAFTGCCGFGNSVLFWKEDKLHKILGAYPSQYTMYEYNVPGVKLGSEQSLCNINEVVYYHGREGVYRYNGGSPELISENFGLRRYEEAAAGAIEGRYYLSMKDRQKGEWGLWVYDTLKNIWLREDDTHAMGFSANEGKLYCIGGSKLMCLNPDDSGEVFEWSATTARMDEVFHNRKCYSKLLLRAELLEDSAWLQVDISCDGEPFKRVYTSRDKAAKTLAIPIMPKRCDSFRIRLSGEGKFIIRSLVREFDIGSEY